MLPLYLSEAGSSVLHLLPILGAALILPGLVNPTSAVQRTGLFVVAILLSLRYLWWRATETIAPLGLTVDWAASWSLFALEALAAAAITAVMTTVVVTTTKAVAP